MNFFRNFDWNRRNGICGSVAMTTPKRHGPMRSIERQLRNQRNRVGSNWLDKRRLADRRNYWSLLIIERGSGRRKLHLNCTAKKRIFPASRESRRLSKANYTPRRRRRRRRRRKGTAEGACNEGKRRNATAKRRRNNCSVAVPHFTVTPISRQLNSNQCNSQPSTLKLL